MTSDDFVAAQQRVVARQQEGRGRTEPQTTAELRQQLFVSPGHLLNTTLFQLWDRIKGREGTRPSFRVGQLDSELLDEELLELLRGQAKDGLKFLGVRARSSKECPLMKRSPTSSKTGVLKSLWSFASYSSNSQSGITTHRTVRLYKAWNIGTRAVILRRDGKKRYMGPSQSLVDIAGLDGRSTLWIGTILYHDLLLLHRWRMIPLRWCRFWFSLSMVDTEHSSIVSYDCASSRLRLT